MASKSSKKTGPPKRESKVMESIRKIAESQGINVEDLNLPRDIEWSLTPFFSKELDSKSQRPCRKSKQDEKKTTQKWKDNTGRKLNIYHTVNQHAKNRAELTPFASEVLTRRLREDAFLYILDEHLPIKYSRAQSQLFPCRSKLTVSEKSSCLALPFRADFQNSFVRQLDHVLLTLPCLFAKIPAIRLLDLLKWYTHQGDRRMNEAYRLFWHKHIIVDCWLTLASLFNWIILSAPPLPGHMIVYRGDGHLPRVSERDVIAVTNFVSTSWSAKIALTFLGRDVEALALYEIVLPSGFPVLSFGTIPGDISQFQDEDELLLPATLDVNGLVRTYGFKVHSSRMAEFPGKKKAIIMRMYPVLLSANSNFKTDDDVWGLKVKHQAKYAERKHVIPVAAQDSLEYDGFFWFRPLPYETETYDEADEQEEEQEEEEEKKYQKGKTQQQSMKFLKAAESKSWKYMTEGQRESRFEETKDSHRSDELTLDKAKKLMTTISEAKDKLAELEAEHKNKKRKIAQQKQTIQDREAELQFFPRDLQDIVRLTSKLHLAEQDYWTHRNTAEGPKFKLVMDETQEAKDAAVARYQDELKKSHAKEEKVQERKEEKTPNKEIIRQDIRSQRFLVTESFFKKATDQMAELVFQAKFDNIHDDICASMS